MLVRQWVLACKRVCLYVFSHPLLMQTVPREVKQNNQGRGKNHFCRGTEFPARNFYFQSFQNGRGGRGCRVTVIVLHCSF